MNDIEVQSKLGGPIIATLTGVGGVPIGIAADSASNVYVTAYPHNFIDVYAAGSTTPTSMVVDIGMTAIFYIAMDKSNNLFYDGWGRGGPGSGLRIDEYNTGSHKFTKLISIPGKIPGGLTFDTILGRLYVADEGNGTSGVIYSLKPPYRKVFRSFSYNGWITGIDLDKSGKHIWASNLNAGGNDVAQKYESHTGALLFTSPTLPTGLFSYGIAVKK